MLTPARRIAFAFLLAAATLIAPLTLAPSAAVAAEIDSPKYAAIVVDANTGEVLFARRADSQRYPASITKVMTMYMAFEALSTGKLHASDRVTISPRAAAAPPSKLGLPAGDSLSVDEAIRIMAVRSTNDIAIALAERIGGTESRFAALMTLKAQELGMSNTRFVNASGLPDSRQLSSARDIAILSRAVMRDYPQYYNYFNIKTMTLRGREYRNTNGLLHSMPGVDGLKTGYTNASGYNLAATAVRDGRRLITVVLGGRSTATRNAHVAELLNVGFDVMRRRERGELITVAQSMFQTEMPAAPVRYASIEQGDRDASPAHSRDITGDLNARALRGAQPASGRGTMQPVADPADDEPAVALASLAPVQERATAKPAAAKPKPTPAAKPKKRDPNAIWVVQVGAFKSKGEANTWLKQVGKRFKTQFAKAEGQVMAASGWHRARFEGMTQDAAKSACEALKAKKLACLVLKGS
ncbi:MAG TPA: D-alanyl-D-alanine carboxypeptidase [Caulobacteraceae bacterium]|nr:D-alanyl-D-alanine carboxypeptidase [Caulobacteraceae bacterium]